MWEERRQNVRMTKAEVDRETLFVPDRFENLRDAGSGALRSVVYAVEDSLDLIDARFRDLAAAGRGGLAVLRGEPGVGKSTFLDTVGLFREGVVTERVPQGEDIGTSLAAIGPTTSPRILVIEGREALLDVSNSALEASMHAINTFVRSKSGVDTLVVWPSNKEDLAEALVELGNSLGGDALLGIDDPIMRFAGPPRSTYVSIAERTVAALNEGASLAALGISAVDADQLAAQSRTVGSFLSRIRSRLLHNGARVRKLLKAEQFRLWTVVIAGNDPEGDVAALTRGGLAYADIDRLMTSTGANIVKELKKEPDTLGILGTVLDAKILHLDMLAALAIARTYASDDLRGKMKTLGMSVSKDVRANERVTSSELGLILAGESLGTRKRGGKPGGGTKTAFEGLASIARQDDGMLNRAVGAALVGAGLVDSYEAEKSLGTSLKYDSDLFVLRNGEPIRIEIMWRTNAGRADIANYVLSKLGNYAKAIGLLG